MNYNEDADEDVDKDENGKLGTTKKTMMRMTGLQ